MKEQSTKTCVMGKENSSIKMEECMKVKPIFYTRKLETE